MKTGGASEVVVNRRGAPRRLSGRRLRACEGAVISFTVWAPAAATVHVVLGTEDALAVQSSKSLARVDRVMAPNWPRWPSGPTCRVPDGSWPNWCLALFQPIRDLAEQPARSSDLGPA